MRFFHKNIFDLKRNFLILFFPFFKLLVNCNFLFEIVYGFKSVTRTRVTWPTIDTMEKSLTLWKIDDTKLKSEDRISIVKALSTKGKKLKGLSYTKKEAEQIARNNLKAHLNNKRKNFFSKLPYDVFNYMLKTGNINKIINGRDIINLCLSSKNIYEKCIHSDYRLFKHLLLDEYNINFNDRDSYDNYKQYAEQTPMQLYISLLDSGSIYRFVFVFDGILWGPRDYNFDPVIERLSENILFTKLIANMYDIYALSVSKELYKYNANNSQFEKVDINKFFVNVDKDNNLETIHDIQIINDGRIGITTNLYGFYVDDIRKNKFTNYANKIKKAEMRGIAIYDYNTKSLFMNNLSRKYVDEIIFLRYSNTKDKYVKLKSDQIKIIYKFYIITMNNNVYYYNYDLRHQSSKQFILTPMLTEYKIKELILESEMNPILRSFIDINNDVYIITYNVDGIFNRVIKLSPDKIPQCTQVLYVHNYLFAITVNKEFIRYNIINEFYEILKVHVRNFVDTIYGIYLIAAP